MTEMLLIANGADAPGIFLSWGIFSIQLGNLIVIIAMFVVFAVALVLPFPRGRREK
jgi:cadmium resistance protein CadD (predicted permease)